MFLHSSVIPPRGQGLSLFVFYSPSDIPHRKLIHGHCMKPNKKIQKAVGTVPLCAYSDAPQMYKRKYYLKAPSFNNA